ncbi:MAG: hypothetical protein PG981_001508 [Wolbachia endosymbiont of Ctenocephalides orientis wCori]|nr:MAG: hypothetical protein PG981_001508 [Wolbachia endosymbiont of Ctenocephalides orientis wCori]
MNVDILLDDAFISIQDSPRVVLKGIALEQLIAFVQPRNV